MSRRLLVLCLLLLAALPAAADAKVRKGPGGSAFYTPPAPLPSGAHGSLIWARRLTGTAALRAGAGNRLVLYRSIGVAGKGVAVSGTVTVPKGPVPKGGWPVITWAHGTTGIADQCAPSRDSKANAAHGLTAYAYPLLQRWLKAGYALVRTDYEGLGTPGDHPYLNGRSEGYAVLDAVRAARRLDKRLSRRVVIAGHSQGGQSALWAASLARRWTPELKVRGTVALAPVSHLAEQTPLLANSRSPAGSAASWR
jgi:pimeloyl-ACP methyl ester carboxylesterase